MPPPSRTNRRPTVVLVSAPGTLEGIDARLRRAGVRPVRLRAIEPRAIRTEVWLPALLKRSAPDTVVVTSRAAVTVGVRPWLRAVGARAYAADFWAVGPRTASALREIGVRRVRRPRAVGSIGIVRALGSRSTRRVLYLRSDRAGPGLARSLRRRGHRVLDRVVYRLGTPRPLAARNQAVLMQADLLVVTSPSGLEALRSRVGAAAFSRLARGVPLVVLGDRSRKAALGLGFRAVSVAPATTAQRFTYYILQELRHAHA